MKQKEVFKKIGAIIQELSDQYEYLKTADEDLNDLELELFVANAHFLTDHIEVLCKLNLQNRVRKPLPEKPAAAPIPEKQAVTREEKFFEPVVQQNKHASENEKESAPLKKKETKKERATKDKKEKKSNKASRSKKPSKRSRSTDSDSVCCVFFVFLFAHVFICCS